MIFVLASNSHAIKNGKRAGTTEVAQSVKPSLDAFKLSLEKTTKPIKNRMKKIGKIFFLKLKNMKLALTFFLIMLTIYGINL